MILLLISCLVYFLLVINIEKGFEDADETSK